MAKKTTTTDLLDLIKLRTEQRNAYRAEVRRLAAKVQNLSNAERVRRSEPGVYTENELYHEVEKLKARLRGTEKQRDALQVLVAKLQAPAEEAEPLL